MLTAHSLDYMMCLMEVPVDFLALCTIVQYAVGLGEDSLYAFVSEEAVYFASCLRSLYAGR